MKKFNMKEYRREYFLKNRERILKHNREWRKSHWVSFKKILDRNRQKNLSRHSFYARYGRFKKDTRENKGYFYKKGYYKRNRWEMLKILNDKKIPSKIRVGIINSFHYNTKSGT